MSALFDYQTLANRLGIPAAELAALENVVRRQYGSDAMLAELRMVRTLRAIEAGALSLSEAIAEFSTDPRSTQTRTA
jgi:hypothetical protein